MNFGLHSITKAVATLALCLLVSACGGGGDSGSRSPPPAGGFVATSLGDALEYGLSQGVDGLWLYVREGQGEPIVLTDGIEERSRAVPAFAGSQFKIASVSKLFIGAAAIRASTDGLLQLDDTLASWLPAESGRIANADEITVRQLLQHRSGVPDFDTADGFSWSQPHTDEDALLELIYDLPADFSPGTRYSYSNTNYLLVGRILNAALGYHHHVFARSQILDPLGMADTVSLLEDTSIDRMAHGYWNGVDRTTQDYRIPGGSMISTIGDVGIFIDALALGQFLTADEDLEFQALYDGYGHSGWLPGYQSIARYVADIDATVVVFVNMTGGNSEAAISEVHAAVVDYLRRN